MGHWPEWTVRQAVTEIITGPFAMKTTLPKIPCGDQLREYLFEQVMDSIGESLRRLNDDHITIETYELQ